MSDKVYATDEQWDQMIKDVTDACASVLGKKLAEQQNNGLIPVEQAASILGMSCYGVRAAARAGRLPAVKPAKRWLIAMTELPRLARDEAEKRRAETEQA